MTLLHVKEVGRQVAFSGLLPGTAAYLLDYLARQGAGLCALVPDGEPQPGDPSQLNFCLLNACLTTPEFSGMQRTRFIPDDFATDVQNELVERYASNLAEPRWQAYRKAANAAALLMDWLEGVPVQQLEDRFPEVRAGKIRNLCRDVRWVLSGLCTLLAAATRPNLSTQERPSCMRALSETAVTNLRRLLAPLRLLAWRLDVGLPPDVLWMTELKTPTGGRAITRHEAFSLHQAGLGSLESLRHRSNGSQLVELLGAQEVSHPQARAGELQKLADEWHDTVLHRSRAGD